MKSKEKELTEKMNKAREEGNDEEADFNITMEVVIDDIIVYTEVI